MRKRSWYITTAIWLVLTSVVIYAVQVYIFRRPTETEFYLLQDLAFLPVQVLLVSIVLNSLLKAREQMELEQKMTMVIGIFFTQMGNELLRSLSAFDGNLRETREILDIKIAWKDSDFESAKKRLEAHKYAMDCHRADLHELKQMLVDNCSLLRELLANPNLLEHGTFTEILWAVTHLSQELTLRPDLDHLPQADYEHLNLDMQRAYSRMLSEWLSYLRQLKQHHPYMFSFVVRMNPFTPHPSAVIGDTPGEI